MKEKNVFYLDDESALPRMEIEVWNGKSGWMTYVSANNKRYHVSRIGNIINPDNGPCQIALVYDTYNPFGTENTEDETDLVIDEGYNIAAIIGDECFPSDDDPDAIEFYMKEFAEPIAQWEETHFKSLCKAKPNLQRLNIVLYDEQTGEYYCDVTFSHYVDPQLGYDDPLLEGRIAGIIREHGYNPEEYFRNGECSDGDVTSFLYEKLNA